VGEVVKTRHSIKAASNIGNFFQALATYAQEQAEQEAITEVEELLEQVMQEHLDDECMACINHQTSGHNHPVTAEEAEYEEWKRLHGYDQPLTRAEYEMLYNPNNLN
jgi:acyl-CoA-binding protein